MFESIRCPGIPCRIGEDGLEAERNKRATNIESIFKWNSFPTWEPARPFIPAPAKSSVRLTTSPRSRGGAVPYASSTLPSASAS
jgi:hypothetical protein